MSHLTDEQVKAAILEFLLKKGRWGTHYFPTATLINWFSRKVKRNGKRVRSCLRSLAGREFLLVHKRGKTISLNPFKRRDILELIERAKSL
jgi:hypothetical protein